MEHRSNLFFPMALIAFGALWLLVNFNVIPGENLWALTRIWPFFLIVWGLSLILRNSWPLTGVVTSAVLVGGAVLAVVFAPQLGWTAPERWHMMDGDFSGRVAGSGQIETETRQISGVNGVSINYPADVTLVQGDDESIVIEADDNLLPQLRTEERDGILVVESNVRNWSERVRPTHPVKITITLANIEVIDMSSAADVTMARLETSTLSVDVSGAGNVTIDDLTTEEFTADLSGAGDMEISGSATTVGLSISGAGNFEGEDFQTQTATIAISGFGDASIRVSDELTVEISGAGSVDYYGSPMVHQDVSGLGDVNQEEE
jgi:hypothetical protein